MSPSVEGFTPTIITGQEGQEQAEWVVIRLDTPDEFDPDSFDKSVCRLGAVLKWIVVGSRMIIFPGNLSHSIVYSSLPPEEVEGELQAAGFLDMPPLSSERQISGYSASLKHILPRDKSNRFKQDMIKLQLGEFFEVLN